MSRRSARPAPDDVLYEAVSEGRRHAGMEHWLPLFHQRMATLFDYIEASPIAIEPLAEEAAHERLAQIADYYQARKEALDQSGAGAPYKPLAAGPALSRRSRMARAARKFRAGAADAVRRAGTTANVIEVGAHAGHNFAAERVDARRQCVRGGDQTRQCAASRRQARARSRCGAKARANAWRMCLPSTALPI